MSQNKLFSSWYTLFCMKLDRFLSFQQWKGGLYPSLDNPLDKIFNNGFRAGHGSSRPTKRIETSSILGCISLETVQNEMHR